MIIVLGSEKMKKLLLKNKKKDIESQIIKFISKKKNCKEKPMLSLKSAFMEIGFDSISFIELVVKVEQVFQIEFDDDHLSTEAFVNIKDFVDYVKIKCQNINFL